MRLFILNKLPKPLTLEEREVLKKQTKNFIVRDGLLSRVTKFRRMEAMPEETIAQLYLPRSCRRKVLRWIHDHPTSAHIGTSKMMKLLQYRYYWPRYQEDVEQWARTCSLCQHYKRTKRRELLHPKGVVGPLETLSIDIVCDFPPYRGYTKILTIVDTFTRWLWLVPLRTKTAKEVGDAIYQHVILEHGRIKHILSDRGTEFVNNILRSISERVGIKHQKT